MRLTESGGCIGEEKLFYTRQENLLTLINRYGYLEDLEEKLGVDLIRFLTELNFILLNCNDTTGHTTDNKKITADYGRVIEFLEKLKEALKNGQ